MRISDEFQNSGAPPTDPHAAVLVVDDDGFMRTLLQRVFLDAGLTIKTYASAEELLASADLRPPAVLLLDMKMPGMSGLELQALLRQRDVALPVIFLSGASDIPIALAAMRNGAVDFLEKPFAEAELVARVRLALRQSELAMTPSAALLADPLRRLHTLTVREREIYDRMIVGKTSKVIALELGGSFRTVEIHRGRVMSKMAATSLADLVRTALQIEASA